MCEFGYRSNFPQKFLQDACNSSNANQGNTGGLCKVDDYALEIRSTSYLPCRAVFFFRSMSASALISVLISRGQDNTPHSHAHFRGFSLDLKGTNSGFLDEAEVWVFNSSCNYFFLFEATCCCVFKHSSIDSTQLSWH